MQSASEVLDVDLDTVADAPATACRLSDVEPRRKRKVNCLCDVVPSIESRVVACGPGDDILTWSLNSSSQLDSLFQQVLRVNHGGLVPDELRTNLELIFEMTLNVALEVFVGAKIDSIPVLGRANVEVVY